MVDVRKLDLVNSLADRYFSLTRDLNTLKVFAHSEHDVQIALQGPPVSLNSVHLEFLRGTNEQAVFIGLAISQVEAKIREASRGLEDLGVSV